MKKASFFALLFVIGGIAARAEQLYVNQVTGKDANDGTRLSPLRTINEAAKRANLDKGKGGTEIILSEGVRLLIETALFTNNKYSSTNRLVIRADIMPDDNNWKPQRMPIIVTVVPLKPGAFGDEANGLQIETSHATIEGIRFSGSPDYWYKTDSTLSRSYPIWRGGKALDDLLVTQCLFAGNKDVLPLHVGVIANGHGLVLDHCVFYNCINPVVFWEVDKGTSNRNGMRYCLVYGCTHSGVWTGTATNANDFEFHHNIFANCQAAWVRENSELVRENKDAHRYRIHDCIFTGNTNIAGYGFDPQGNAIGSPTDFLIMENVVTSGIITIEKSQKKHNYLQLAEGSPGSELGAGLFKH
ncbi:MAG TPA: hypothetical protein VGM41_18265 [Chitinophagaceae bacterium]|jgi:hypothetical protein